MIGEKKTLAELVDYQAESVVSKTIIKKEAGTVTLFAFAEAEGLSEHTSPHEAMVYLLDGEAMITWIQVSSATKLFLNKSIGVLNCNDFLGLLFNLFSTKRVCCSSMFLKESFLGKY